MKFGSVNVPDAWLWMAGLLIPVGGALLYHHLVADPTDIVTDVRSDPSGALIVVYNAGPNDTFALPLPATSWVTNAAKQALAGLTRDRVKTSLRSPFLSQ